MRKTIFGMINVESIGGTFINSALYKNFLIILLSGLILNIPFFFQNIRIEFLVFFIIAPVFISLRKIPNNQRYFAGLLFFGAWLIPTSYWYFNFMPWWLAILSMTFFALIANTFRISNLIKNNNILLDFSIIIFSWIILTFLRINLPILEDWWIPHLAYTQWQNLIILQIANLTGIFGIIFLILLSNAVIAYLWIKNKRLFLLIFSFCLIATFIVGNLYITNISHSEKQNFNFIGIQVSPEKGFYANANLNDIKKLKKMTKRALLNIKNKENKTFVLWPENMIDKKHSQDLEKFARENNIYLVFNRAEKINENLYNTVIVLDSNGTELLKNYKTHSAPSEKVTVKKNVHNSVKIDNIKITSDICYDLHYKDISKRVNNNDILFAPVDDDRFGRFMPYLHAKDIIFRAIENRINIFTASTNGPTMFVDKYGVIKKGPLMIYDENFLILDSK